MPGWLDGELRRSHSFCKLIDAPSDAVAYRDRVLGWSIAKAGGEEGYKDLLQTHFSGLLN
jgi:hypothetical protein